MKDSDNEAALRIANLFARVYGWDVRPMTARFTGGGEGYSLRISPTDPLVARYNSVFLHFNNDDEYGPRWSGLAGRRVPRELLVKYAHEISKDPSAHPGMINRVLPDQT